MRSWNTLATWLTSSSVVLFPKTRNRRFWNSSWAGFYMDVNKLVHTNANKCRVLFYRPLHTTGDVNLSLSFSWNLHLRVSCGSTKKNLQNWYYVVKTCLQLRFGILNTRPPEDWHDQLSAIASGQFHAVSRVFTMRFTVGLINVSFKSKFFHTFKCAYAWTNLFLTGFR